MRTGYDPIQTRDGDDFAGMTPKEAILAEARERADYGLTQWQHNFDASRDEVGFLYGDQWPEAVKAQRDAQSLPSLTLNNLPTHIDQVVGDQRMARPQVKVIPADDADYDIRPEPATDAQRENPGLIDTIKLSDCFAGLIRNIEYVSGAEMHYDQAFQQAVEGGFGWLRVVSDYSSESSFDQELFIRYIRNRYSVIMDPDADEPDYSDANWCFILERQLRREFVKRYPEAREIPITEGLGLWGDEHHVTVAEYFRREPMQRELLLFNDGTTQFRDVLDFKSGKTRVNVVDEMAAAGVEIVRSRKVNTFKVLWSKVTAYDILEKDREWPGRTIPVVPVLGKWVDKDEGPEYRGLTRYAKDAKRMHNYMMSAATARVALAPKAPWTGTAKMFEGYEDIWANANRENRAYLPFNVDPDSPGMRPVRADAANMPAAELQLGMGMSDQVKATIGQYDASLGARSNETSGRAIVARQREGDVGAYAFVDNLNRAVAKVGRILIEVIPRIYDTERVVRIRHENGKTQSVRINRLMRDTDSGETVLVNDIAVGRFDVQVRPGPSHTTQRAEAVDALTQFIQAAPATAPVVMDILAGKMDWPGADEIAARLRFLVPRNVLSAEEQEEMPEQPPTPEQQAEMAKAQAEMEKAKADVAMAQAKTLEAQAKIAEINAIAEGGSQLAVLVRSIVADAIAELQQQTKA